MFSFDYKVLGSDVGDCMIMESHAYFSYSLRHMYNFLFTLGYSKQKLNRQNIRFQEQKSHFEQFKPLMFGNHFNLELDVKGHNPQEGFLDIKNCFYNTKDELCAIINAEIIFDAPKMARHNVLDGIICFSGCDIKESAVFTPRS